MMVETNIIKWFKEAWKENSGEEYTQPLGGLPFCSNDNWRGHVVMEFALFIEKKAHQQGSLDTARDIREEVLNKLSKRIKRLLPSPCLRHDILMEIEKLKSGSSLVPRELGTRDTSLESSVGSNPAPAKRLKEFKWTEEQLRILRGALIFQTAEWIMNRLKEIFREEVESDGR